jgi:hypothetical protein
MRPRPMRTIRQPVQAQLVIPAQPPMDRLPGHPEPIGDLSYRQAGLHFQHGAIPLFRHPHLHQHSAECHASSEAS